MPIIHNCKRNYIQSTSNIYTLKLRKIIDNFQNYGRELRFGYELLLLLLLFFFIMTSY